jgi:hypothetical protein
MEINDLQSNRQNERMKDRNHPFRKSCFEMFFCCCCKSILTHLSPKWHHIPYVVHTFWPLALWDLLQSNALHREQGAIWDTLLALTKTLIWPQDCYHNNTPSMVPFSLIVSNAGRPLALYPFSLIVSIAGRPLALYPFSLIVSIAGRPLALYPFSLIVRIAGRPLALYPFRRSLRSHSINDNCPSLSLSVYVCVTLLGLEVLNNYSDSVRTLSILYMTPDDIWVVLCSPVNVVT